MGVFRYEHWIERAVGYDALLKSERRRIHGAAAACLDSTTGGAPEPDALRLAILADDSGLLALEPAAAEVARHLESAGEGRAAGLRYVVAARHGARSADVAAADAAATNALLLLDPAGERGACVEVALQCAQLLERAGRYRETERWLGDAWDRLGDASDRSVVGLRSRFFAARGSLFTRTARLEEAERDIAAALELARDAGEVRAETQARGDLGVLRWMQTRYDDALGEFRRALDGARRAGLGRAVAAAMNNLSICHFRKGELEAAMASAREGLEHWRRLSDPYGETVALVHIANVHAVRDEDARALAAWGEAIEIWRRLGFRLAEALVVANAASCKVRLGRFDEALAELRASRETYRHAGDPRNVAVFTGEIAEAHYWAGSYAEARDAALEAEDGARAASAPDTAVVASATLSLALLRLGDRPGARAAAVRSHRDAEAMGQPQLRAKSRIALALAGSDAALALEAGDIARACGDRDLEGQALCAASEAAGAAGDAASARSLADRARGFASSLESVRIARWAAALQPVGSPSPPRGGGLC